MAVCECPAARCECVDAYVVDWVSCPLHRSTIAPFYKTAVMVQNGTTNADDRSCPGCSCCLKRRTACLRTSGATRNAVSEVMLPMVAQRESVWYLVMVSLRHLHTPRQTRRRGTNCCREICRDRPARFAGDNTRAKVLIANRGEIARRVIRSAKSLGVKTVVVFTETDALSLHVKDGDEAVCLGANPREYTNAQKLLEIAKSTK